MNALVAPAPSAFRSALVALLLTLAIGATFHGVGKNEFILLDDDLHLTHNPHLKPQDGNVWEVWKQPYQGLYIPLTYTLWGAQKAVFQRYWGTWGGAGSPRNAEARLYHTVNLAFHAANTFLVFRILLGLLGLEWVAFFGALLFGLHPVQVEALAWISGFKDVLSGFFSLLSLNAYLSAGRRLRERRIGAGIRYIAAAIAFAAALLSKPSAVVVPLIAFALEVGVSGERWSRSALRLLPALMPVLPLAWLTKHAQPSVSLSYVAPVSSRPLIASDALTFYFSKVLVPLKLAPDYGRHPHQYLTSVWKWITWVVPCLLLLVLWRRERLTQAAFAVFIAGLLPVLGFVPFYFQEFSTVADRYLYLPMLGPAVLAAAWLARRSGKAAMAGASVALGVLAAIAHAQAGQWKDSQTLFEHTIRVNQDSLLAHNNLGTILEERGDWLSAAFHYKEVLRIEPENLAGHYNFGRLLARLGRYDWAKKEFERVLRREPNVPDAQFSLALLSFRTGEIERAKAHFFIALKQRPNHAATLAQLGQIYRTEKNCAQAMRYFEAALIREPDQGEAHFGKGKCLLEKGRKQEAIRHFEAAARREPQWTAPQQALAELGIKVVVPPASGG